MTKKLCSKLESLEVILAMKHEIESGDLYANCNKGPLKTAAKRSAFYHKHFAFCDPVEVFLGLDDQLKRRNYQYVPICQSIANLYRHYASHFHFFSKAYNADENYHLCDISDCQVFKKNSRFCDKKAVAIILYQYAFEVVNPLGSAKKTQKYGCVLYSCKFLFGTAIKHRPYATDITFSREGFENFLSSHCFRTACS